MAKGASRRRRAITFGAGSQAGWQLKTPAKKEAARSWRRAESGAEKTL